MTGPPVTKRTLRMVETYKAGGTLREVAEQFGVTMQCVHQHVKRHAPGVMRSQGRRYGQHTDPSDKVREMIEVYKSGATLHEVAKQFGVLMQSVHKSIQRHAPSAMRPPHITRFPSVGPPGHELYRVGTCSGCEAALFAYRPEPREICGHCEEAKEAAA